jgi:sigma-B regulation protein RsbU (phosphoserine phosphatase)
MAKIDHELLMALMDTIPDRIYFKDRDGRFLSVNKAMRVYMKISDEVSDDEAFKGKTDFDFFLPEHAKEAFADEQRVLATGEPVVGKMEREILPDGRIAWVSTTKVPMRGAGGAIIGTCGISRDITEEHEKTEKLKEYAQALAEKQAQTEAELAMATQVQQALLPQSYPSFPRGAAPGASALRFAHRYLPEALVGGDFFMVTQVSESQSGVLICDVMGHGVPAALVTAVQRVLVEELQYLAGNPGAFLGELNRRLHHFLEPLQSSMFVTALYLVIDTVTGSVRFANASHPLPLHLNRAKNEVRIMGTDKLRHPFALGVANDSVYTTEEDSVRPGELLFLYTDGLCDLGEGKDLEPDDPRFLNLIRNCSRHTGEAFLDAVLEQARQFSGREKFLDDVCLVAIEVERLLG